MNATHDVRLEQTVFTRIGFGYVFAILAMVACLVVSSCSGGTPAFASPPAYVVDQADIFSPAERMVLNHHLSEVQTKHKVTIIVLNVKSLNGQDIKDFAIDKAREWKIGTRDNRGVLFIHALEERKIRIEVGYGLEGVLTDIRARQIIEKDAVPYFRKRDYYTGTGNVISSIIKIMEGK